MRNYDDLNGFIDYASKEEWRKYIQQYVIPLWRDSWILKEYWEGLKNEFDGLPFDDVKKEDRPLLLGGIIQQENNLSYAKNSLAMLYDFFFGLRLKNIQSWILQSQTGEAITEINVEVVETEFINFVKEVFELLDYGLSYQQLVTDYKEPELNYEELKRNPNNVKGVIKNFYQEILNISLNYNYGTFFLCSVNQITYKYMKTAYPRIDNVLDFLINEFGLTELDWDNPIKPNTKTYRDYTIYCFPEYNPHNKGASFGGAICKLNELIWKRFTTPRYETSPNAEFIYAALYMLFGNIPDLLKEFKDKIKNKVPEFYFYDIRYDESLMADALKMDMLKGYPERSQKPLLDILDLDSPHLFLNMLEINRASLRSMDFSSRWY